MVKGEKKTQQNTENACNQNYVKQLIKALLSVIETLNAMSEDNDWNTSVQIL